MPSLVPFKADVGLLEADVESLETDIEPLNFEELRAFSAITSSAASHATEGLASAICRYLSKSMIQVRVVYSTPILHLTRQNIWIKPQITYFVGPYSGHGMPAPQRR